MVRAFFSAEKPILFDNIVVHLLHSRTHCDLDHSWSIHHKSSDTVARFSCNVRRAMEESIPNDTGAHYQTSRRQLPWRWLQKSSRKRILFNNVEQIAPGSTFSTPILGTFAHFLTDRLHRAIPLMTAAFFQPKTDHLRYYYYAIIALLYSMRLRPRWSILHKSRYTVTWS